MGWAFYDKYKLHAELGSAFVHVTPGKNQVSVADPEAVEEIFSRRLDFPKPVHIYKMLEVFGPNANTVEGHDWQRHRKITAPPFNERNSNLVWEESLRQAREMLQWWTREDRHEAINTLKDTRLLSLHVLAGAGFGESYPFFSALEPPAEGYSMTYRDALSLILEYTLIIIVIPRSVMMLPFMPKNWKKAGQATKDFKNYMKDMLDNERQRASGDSKAANLMSALIRSSDDAGKTDQEVMQGLQGLTDDEILGNMFLYNFAGHETSGNSLTYSITLLSAYPEWQAWVAEEIEQIFGDQEPSESWSYSSYPALKRCQAVMLETLRLFSPVIAIPKYTKDRSQLLNINGHSHTIPPDTLVLPNVCAMHTDPRYWGEDSLIWRPSRWLTNEPCDTQPGGQRESLIEPRKGTYFPWSAGARVCVGRKFSQVEFVASLAVLMQHHRVQPVLQKEETPKDSRERILRVIEDSHLRMLLQIKHPGRATVEWRRSEIR